MGANNSTGIQELPLRGARVLIVEDEYYIADDLRRELSAAGATVVGPVSTLENAREAVDLGDFDCAVIDLNLHGESAVPIAEWLLKQGKSFVITTGYGSDVVPDELKGVPRIEKPYDPPALLRLTLALGCRQPSGSA